MGDVRRMLAVEHLKSGYLTTQEIAYTLGYTDLANSRRAFKRWQGVPPSAYRAREIRFVWSRHRLRSLWVADLEHNPW